MGRSHQCGKARSCSWAMNPGTCLVRVAALLAIGCFAIAHGSTEQEVFNLGEAGDLGAEAKEQQIEADVQQEDPSLAEYDINASDQEDRIGGASDDFDSEDDETRHRKHRRATVEKNSMQAELRAIQGDDKEPSAIGETDEPSPAENIDEVSNDQTTAAQDESKIQDEGVKAKQVEDKQKLAAEVAAQKKAEEEKIRKDNELAAAKQKQERGEKDAVQQREQEEEKTEKVAENQKKADDKAAAIEKEEKNQQKKAE